jgi:hypothetical protein
MTQLNADGLPQPVVHSLELMIQSLKDQFAGSPGNPTSLERMKRAAGGWSDDPQGLDEYLRQTRENRQSNRAEPPL